MFDVYEDTIFAQDLLNDSDLMNLIADETFAKNLYASLCNTQWVKDTYTFSASFRYAGGLVAFLRNEKHGLNEDYLDFYMSGSEGKVFPEVEESLQKLGWKPKPYDN